ncbi:MAG: hypothetical protein KDD51_16910, partial [Bdellovibrionales bacterium]|nr:hypothetical protein [Bdellovibrionales bacterium]
MKIHITALFSLVIFCFIQPTRCLSADVTISDDDSEVTFSVEDYGVKITSFKDKKINKSLLNPVNTSRLFDIELTDREQKTLHYSGHAGWQGVELRNGDGYIHVTQSHAAGFRVKSFVQLIAGKLYARYKVEVPDTLTFTRLWAMPMFFGPNLGGKTGDTVHYPNGSGIVERVNYDKETIYAKSYPTGRQSYQMMGVYNAVTG